VQPVCMRFPYLHWDLFLDDSQFNNLWRTLCQFVNFGSYTYLEEYRPSEVERKNPQTYANNVRDAMAREMNISTSGHQFEDVLLLKAARKAHVSVDFAMTDAKHLLHLERKELESLISRFKTLDNDHDGVINFDEFCRTMDLDKHQEMRESAKHLFDLFDSDHSGGINFREFVVAVSVFSHRCTAVDSANVVFLICDLHSRQEVIRQEFEAILMRMSAPEDGKNPAPIKIQVEQIVEAVFQKEIVVGRELFVKRLESQHDTATNILQLFLYKKIGLRM